MPRCARPWPSIPAPGGSAGGCTFGEVPGGSAPSQRDGSAASRVHERLSVCLSVQAHNFEVVPVDAPFGITEALAEAERILRRPPRLDESLQAVVQVAENS